MVSCSGKKVGSGMSSYEGVPGLGAQHLNKIYWNRMRVSSREMLQILTGFLLLVIAGCADSSSDPVSEDPVAEQPGFTGSVSGAVVGEISGPGVATYLPPQDTIDGVRSGYFLIANVRGASALVITFRLPAKAQSGTYPLVAADPMALGENFEVRVESIADGRPVAYGLNTDGTLRLETFPSDGATLSGAKIKGSFQFVTQDSKGESLAANGTFEFVG